jgi:hypothetical protein
LEGSEGLFCCEDPEAFRTFGARDGKIARLRANQAGLVAVYIGNNRDKRNLFRDIQGKAYWAITVDLAERLLSGGLVWLESFEEAPFLEWLARRCKAEKLKGRLKYYRLKDGELAADMGRQLQRIRFLSASGSTKTPLGW